MAKKTEYIELEGNPVYTDRNIVEQVEQNFLKAARAKPGATFLVRQKGFGKDGLKQWADARKDVYVLGATKTKEDYWDRKAKGKKKGGLPKYDPQKAVPRTSGGAIFYHTAERENLKLQKELSESNLSDADKNAEYHSRKIRVQVEGVKPSDIKYFQKEGKGDKAFALAAEQRDKRIAKYEPTQVRMTQSGAWEGRSEFNARMLYEGIQESRKATKLSPLEKIARYGIAEDGKPKLVPSSIQITDEFIDTVNTKKFKTVEEKRAFKAGALKFLQNKELYQQIQTPDAPTFTPQRLEDTRSWHSGSLINPLRQGIAAQQELNLPSALQHGEDSYSKPNYRIVKGQVDTEYTGSTLITGETVTGPETPETVTMASSTSQSDYAASIDEELDMKGSSFENMLPDETEQKIKDFNYALKDELVPIQITSSAEELQLSNEPTIHETVVDRTKGGTWDWENPKQATTWKGYPGQIYHAERVDTGKTAAELNLTPKNLVQYGPRSPSNYYSLAEYPHDISSLISSSMSRVVNQGAPEYDAVQSFLQGDSFTEEDGSGQKGSKPPVQQETFGLLESYRESTDMISIDDAEERGFTGKKSGITSAFPAQFGGQTSINASTPKYEATTAMPGSDPKYVMTPDDIAREQRIGRATAAGQGVGVKPIVTRKEVGGGYNVKVYTEPKLPMSQRDAMVKFGEMIEREKKVFYDKEAKKKAEAPKFKKGDVLKYKTDYGAELSEFELVVSKSANISGINVVYHKALEGKGWSSTEVVTGRNLVRGGTRKAVIEQTQKIFSDPKQVTNALTVIKEVRSSNAKAGVGPTPETIELFKSRITGAYDTKTNVRKKAVKTLINKVPNIKGASKAILPAVGIGSLLVAPAIAEAALWDRNPTLFDRGKQYLREFLGNTKVASGIDEEPGYLNTLGIFGDYDPKKLREFGRRRKSGLTGKGNASIINMLKPSTDNAWKNRRGARRN